MQTAIYSKIIGQVLRHFLTIAAGYLIFVGVDKESNTEFVNVTVNILVPVLILAAVQLAGYLQKRTAEYRARYALAAPVGTQMEEVDILVASRKPPAVSM